MIYIDYLIPAYNILHKRFTLKVDEKIELHWKFLTTILAIVLKGFYFFGQLSIALAVAVFAIISPNPVLAYLFLMFTQSQTSRLTFLLLSLGLEPWRQPSLRARKRRSITSDAVADISWVCARHTVTMTRPITHHNHAFTLDPVDIPSTAPADWLTDCYRFISSDNRVHASEFTSKNSP